MSLIDAYRDVDSNRDRELDSARSYRYVILWYQDNSPDYLSGTGQRKLEKALALNTNPKFAAHYAKLDALAADRSLLVSGSEPPSTLALARARAVLQQSETESLEPIRVVASAEGGVAICFTNGKKYSDIETLNSGEILGVTSDRRDTPVVWEVDPTPSGIAGAVARIREFLDGRIAWSNDPQR
jgi:hypothetical protein